MIDSRINSIHHVWLSIRRNNLIAGNKIILTEKPNHPLIIVRKDTLHGGRNCEFYPTFAYSEIIVILRLKF